MPVYGVKNRLCARDYRDQARMRKIMEQTADLTERLQNGQDKGKNSEATKPERDRTHTDIIVMPDGSRVLVITMNMGGMQTSMSLEISKPTEMPNDAAKIDDHVDPEQTGCEII